MSSKNKIQNTIKFSDEQLKAILQPSIDALLEKTDKNDKPTTFKRGQLITKFNTLLGFVDDETKNNFVNDIVQNVFKDRVKITLANVYSEAMLQIKYFNDSLLKKLTTTKPNKEGKVEVVFSIDSNLIDSIVEDDNSKLFVEDKKSNLRLLSINWTNETLRRQQRIAEPSDK